MIKYTGPKVKLLRKFGDLNIISTKSIKKRIKTPGVHGKINYINNNRISLSDFYKQRLIEKQKLKSIFGISEKYLKKVYNITLNKNQSLYSFLCLRLDFQVYSLNLATTIYMAKQLINHGKIFVNNKKVTISSYICNSNDIISYINNKNKKIELKIKNNLPTLPLNEIKIKEFFLK